MLEAYTELQKINGKATGLRSRKYREILDDRVSKKEGEKQMALSKATVAISTGKVFYVDPVSRADIADAISIGNETGQTSTLWKLAEPINGSKLAVVTMAEMQEARALGLQLKGQIVGV